MEDKDKKINIYRVTIKLCKSDSDDLEFFMKELDIAWLINRMMLYQQIYLNINRNSNLSYTYVIMTREISHLSFDNKPYESVYCNKRSDDDRDNDDHIAYWKKYQEFATPIEWHDVADILGYKDGQAVNSSFDYSDDEVIMTAKDVFGSKRSIPLKKK